jgi:hypothetical protein
MGSVEGMARRPITLLETGMAMTANKKSAQEQVAERELLKQNITGVIMVVVFGVVGWIYMTT